MPRIAGVDIPDTKKLRYALRYIYGIGPKFANDILAEAAVDPDKRARELTDQEVSQITAAIDAGYIVEGALRRQVQQHIQRRFGNLGLSGGEQGRAPRIRGPRR